MLALPQAITLLSQISQTPGVATRQQQMAARLAARMQSPIRVGVFGGDVALVSFLFNTLSDAIDLNSSQSKQDQIGGFELYRCDKPDFTDVDIAIWVTRQFDGNELAFWSPAPNRLKDHSFIVAIYEAGTPIPDQRTPWVDATLDEFAKFIALPLQDGQCKVAPLLSAIQTSVAQGRQADQDHADYLLATLKDKVAFTPPQAVPVQSSSAVPTPEVSAPSAAVDNPVWLEAAGALVAPSSSLTALVQADGPPDCTDVLAICTETAEVLSNVFASAHAEDAYQRRFQDDVMMAVDNLVLMSLENDAASATDAVTTLLQLKKDITLQLNAA